MEAVVTANSSHGSGCDRIEYAGPHARHILFYRNYPIYWTVLVLGTQICLCITCSLDSPAALNVLNDELVPAWCAVVRILKMVCGFKHHSLHIICTAAAFAAVSILTIEAELSLE